MNEHFKSILVPVDGSAGSSRAAAYAADLARAVDCPVTLLFVYHPDPNRVMGMVGLTRERIEEISKEAGAKIFASAREAMGEGSFEIEERVIWGEPREEILAEADKREALIVMGRRGLGQMKELMVGSVSAGVLHTSKRPVTIVN
ncbi:MAG: universal stress protein [Wenzhouxiangella sp.]|nr:MAG: universal stress protein [Wenzhouxiangella sp.]